MMEVSTSIKTEEDESELSLELSIGRKCYNTTTTPILPQKSIDLAHEQTKCNMITSTFPTSQLHPAIGLPFKREIQALRQQEARRKRDQKLKFKSTLSSRGGAGGQNENVCCVINYEDHALVEDEEDDDEEAEMPPRKKEKSLSFSNTNNHNDVVSIVGPEEEEQEQEQEQEEKLLVRDLNFKINRESGLMGESPYPTLSAIQYVPFANGFVYHPHGLMPSCLGSSLVTCPNGFIDKDKRVSFGNGTGGNEGPEKDHRRVSFDTAACRSFRPYSRNLDMNVVNAKSDASSGGSSPAVSDHHNSSLQGGSSSINFPRESRNAFSAGNGPKRSEIKCWDSMGMGSKEVKDKTKANHTVNMTLSTNIQVRKSLRCSEEPKPAGPLKDPALSTKNPIDPVLLKNETRNAVIANTLKTQLQCNGASPLPQMPCVSTTGNGPNGKTITGLLYRYTKTEVCIVCVCHGTLFSPAEFVKHAGGVDVEHPLRHITIVPSDLA